MVGNMVGSEGGEFLFELKPEPLRSLTQQLDGQGPKLNEERSTLEKEIAAQAGRAVTVTAERSGGEHEAGDVETVTRSRPRWRDRDGRAYDLDREGFEDYCAKKYAEALKNQEAVDFKPTMRCC